MQTYNPIRGMTVCVSGGEYVRREDAEKEIAALKKLIRSIDDLLNPCGHTGLEPNVCEVCGYPNPKKFISVLKESVEFWKREYRLINAAQIAAEERVKELEDKLEINKSFIPCAYCGHKIKRGDATAAAISKHIIEDCPYHPIRTCLEDNKRLNEALQKIHDLCVSDSRWWNDESHAPDHHRPITRILQKFNKIAREALKEAKDV